LIKNKKHSAKGHGFALFFHVRLLPYQVLNQFASIYG